ncbi:uncharacterized protein LOC143493196 [Brachyhypopomus gauderio]|uniref:uncharacterized protein LOC143493196 n=1 Tax=Brachyhypopomus gauderio TaxID=698409 RepID=UPI004042CF27
MSTLQDHISDILYSSAKIAADEIVKLLNSSVKALSKELRHKQEKIYTLGRKLELAEARLDRQAYFSGEYDVSLNGFIKVERYHEVHSENTLPQLIRTDFIDSEKRHVPSEMLNAEECFQFEIPSMMNTSCLQLIHRDENADHSQTVTRDEHTEETAHVKMPADTEHGASQAKRQTRDRKRMKNSANLVCEHPKHERERPRKIERSVFTQSSETSLTEKGSANEAQDAQLKSKDTEAMDEESVNQPSDNTLSHGRSTQTNLLFGTRATLNVQEDHACGPEALKSEQEKEFVKEEDLVLDRSPGMKVDKSLLQQKDESCKGHKKMVSSEGHTVDKKHSKGRTDAEDGTSKAKRQKTDRKRANVVCEHTKNKRKRPREIERSVFTQSIETSLTETEKDSSNQAQDAQLNRDMKPKKQRNLLDRSPGTTVDESLLLQQKDRSCIGHKKMDKVDKTHSTGRVDADGKTSKAKRKKDENQSKEKRRKGKSCITCSKCLQAFKRKTKKKIHEKFCFKKSKIRPSICGATSVSKDRAAHTKVQQLSCASCIRRFKAVFDLRKRLQSPGGETSACILCKFGSLQNCRRSERIAQRPDLCPDYY